MQYKQYKSMPSKQRGISLSGFMTLCVVGIIVGILAIKIGPLYQEYYMLEKIIVSLSKEPERASMPAPQLRAAVMRRLDVNFSTRLREDDIQLKRLPGNTGWHMVVDYESRRTIMGNLDAVARFHIEQDFTRGAGAQ